MSFPWMPRSRRRAATRLTSASSRDRQLRARRRLSLDALEDRTLLSTSIPLNSVSWTQIGPAPITNTSGAGGTGGSTGRVTGLAADPTNVNVLYLSAAGGGVWKSTNGGTSWSARTDTQVVSFMGAVAVAPSNTQIVYAGTGEASNLGDSFYGKGILKSTDGGSTWTLQGTVPLNGLSIANIAIAANNPNVVYAAATSLGVNNNSTNRSGIYKTTDGGLTWTNTTASMPQGTFQFDQWTDVVVDATNSNIAYAANGLYVGDTQNGVYKTTNGGSTWSLAGNFPKGTANGQIALAISRSNPLVVVASVSNPANDGLKYVQRTTDGGTTWTALTSAPDYLGGGNGVGQGWYNNVIAIDPTNPQVIFAAGVVTYGNPDRNGIVESRDGGATWFDITIDKNGNEPHTDSHAMTFDANGRLIIGNDGGVWRLDNPLQGQLVWTNINSNLSITQFTGAALDPTNANVMYGGTQDNGTVRFNDSTSWRQVWGGDGGYVKVDPVTPNVVYTENFGISLRRSTDGGNTWQSVVSGINQNDPSNFYVYYTIDPTNHNRLYYGTNRIYVSNNQGSSWTALTTPNQNGWTTSSTINWITVAPSDANTIYATTSDGHIWVSTNGGAAWTQRDVAAAKDSFQQIVVDPSDARVAYIVRNAFNDANNVGHVFKTTNGGASWTDISGSLPDVPCWSIAIDTRGSINRMYVGTDTGVYAATIGTTSWAAYKTGLPNAQVVSLEIAPAIDVIMAATHGRGVWQILSTDQLSVLGVAPAPGVEGTPLTDVTVAMFTDTPSLGPIGNYTATIDWGDNTGFTIGTITDLGNGFYGVSGSHLYTDFGIYQVRVTVVGTNGHSGAGAVAVTINDAPLTPQPLTFQTVVGATYAGVAGSFLDANIYDTVGEFTATINWGNGNQTAGTIVQIAPGEFEVRGSTIYRNVGTYAVTISVRDIGGSTTTINSTAIVGDAPIDPVPRVVAATEGALYSGVLGGLTTPNQFASVNDYQSIVVSWGDGTPDSFLGSGITIANMGGGNFNINGSHTYARFGDYALTITVVTVGNTTIVIPSSAHVSDAALTVSVTSQSTVEGGTVTGIIGTITDANPNGVAADLLGGSTIDWGDGSPLEVIQAGQLVSLGNGRFNVLGTHTYGNVGSNPLTITAVSVGGSTASRTGVVNVVNAPIHPVAATVSGIAGQLVANTQATAIASFTDDYAQALTTDHTATINWGDGTITPGTIIQPGGVGTMFYVIGGTQANPGHRYARAGQYSVLVTIDDVSGTTSDSVTSTANISDSPIVIPTPQPTIPAIAEGESYSGPVARFSNGNVLSTPADFIVTVDWGDGTQTLGQVQAILDPITTQPTGSFNVLSGGSHLYTETGNYPISVLIISLGGSRNTAFNSITVVEPPILPVQTPALTGVAGSTVSGIAAVFTEYAGAAITDFTASIDWGDGSAPTVGTIAKTGTGAFSVSGSHVYATFGTFVTKITVQDVDDPTVVNPPVALPGSAVTTDAALAASSTPIAAVAGFLYSGSVATFTTPNVLATAGEFVATIVWGDGSAGVGLVTGGNGSFLVSGQHTYVTPSSGLPVSVTITHYNPSNVAGTSATVSDGTARILQPVSGLLSPASDSGPSNADGITNVTTPTFTGRGEPGATVKILVGAAGQGLPGTEVGTGLVDSAGNWSIQISPLGDGSYVFAAQMVDAVTGITVQTVNLPTTPGGGALLVVDTAGPTVAGVAFTPRNGQIVVTLNDALAGLDLSGVNNRGNYQLARPAGAALTPYALRAFAAGGTLNQQVVTVNYNLGARVRTGVYVVTINARGITDLAGNILHETKLVEFPQTSNVPNPNYIAQFNVATNLSASGPKPYISIPEQVAAATYSSYSQSRKVVRVPPRPSNFPIRRGRR